MMDRRLRSTTTTNTPIRYVDHQPLWVIWFISILCFGFVGIDWFSDDVLAASPGIEITEIMYDLSGSDTDREWIEITNRSDQPAEIITGSGTNSWRVFDTSNHVLTSIQGSSTLEPHTVAVIAQDANRFLVDYPNFTGTLFRATLSLPNTSATLKLSSTKGVNWFHERAYSKDHGASGDNHSLEWLTDHWIVSSSVGGTPGTYQESVQDALPSPAPTPTNLPVPVDQLSPPTAAPAAEPIILPPPLLIEPRLVITEITYDLMGSDTGREWIEVQNQGTGPLIVTPTSPKWRLKTGNLSHPIHRPDDLPSISVGERFLIVRNRSQFETQVPHPPVAILTANFTLHNTQGDLDLSLDDGQIWIAATHYHQTSGARGDGRSLEILPDGGWQPSFRAGGTPGGPAEIWEPTWLAAVVINEFLPNPANRLTGGWVEVANLGDRPIDLLGWYLDDGLRGSRTYRIPADRSGGTIVEPRGFLVFRSEETHINLGADDEVRLLAPDQQVIQFIPYSDPQPDSSWMRTGTGLGDWTALVSPGTINRFVQPKESPTANHNYPPVVSTEHAFEILDQTQATDFSDQQLPRESGWHIQIKGMIQRKNRNKLSVTTAHGEELTVRLHFTPPEDLHTHQELLAAGRITWEADAPELAVLTPADLHIETPEPVRKNRSTKEIERPAKQTNRLEVIETVIGHSHSQSRMRGSESAQDASTNPLPLVMIGSIFSLLIITQKSS